MTDDKLRARLIEALDSIARCGSGFISPASNADALLPLVRAFLAEHSISGGSGALPAETQPVDGWAHLTIPADAQQDDDVERAAQAIWESQPGAVPWSELSPRTPTRDEYRRFARAALSARPSADTETLRALAADFDANGNGSPVGDSAGNAWRKAARLLRTALDGDR